MTNARILCINNSLAQLTIMSNVLRREGYTVDTATDGRAGLRKAQETKPVLIILDLLIPGIDGYEVCRQLKDDPATARIGIIILTTKGDVDAATDESWRFAHKVQERLKGYDAGALEFLTKPVKAKDLVARVKALLWALGLA